MAVADRVGYHLSFYVVLAILFSFVAVGDAVNLLDYHSKGPLPLFNRWWVDAVALQGDEGSCLKVSRTRTSQLGVESLCEVPAGTAILRSASSDWLDPYALLKRVTAAMRTPHQREEHMDFIGFISRSPIEREILNELITEHEDGQPLTLKPCGTVLQVVPPSSPSALATLLLRLLLVPSSSSALQPWLQLLPTVGDSPLQWDTGDVELLRGTVLHEDVEAFLDTAKHSFEVLDSHFFQKHGNTFPKSLFTMENFLWAYHLVVSRSYILGQGGFDRRVMLPKVDMLNHGIVRSTSDEKTPKSVTVANAAIKVTEAAEGDTAFFIVESVAHVKAGEEVLINYGQFTNAELLLQYGFMMEGNALNARLQAIRQQLLKRQPQELLGIYETMIGELADTNTHTEEVPMPSVRKCQEWESLLAVGMGDLNGNGAEKKALYLQGQEKNLEKCIGILEVSLDVCTTTVTQDSQLLASRSLTDHQALAVRARLEEKRGVFNAASALSEKLEFGLSFTPKERRGESSSKNSSTSPSLTPTPTASGSLVKKEQRDSSATSLSRVASQVPQSSASVTPSPVTPTVSPVNDSDKHDTDFHSAIANAPQENRSKEEESVRAKEDLTLKGVSKERRASVERLRAQHNLMTKLRTELNTMDPEDSVIQDATWREIPLAEESSPYQGRYMGEGNRTTIALLVATICTKDVVSALELPLISILTESFVSTLCMSAVTDNCRKQPTIVNGEYREQGRSTMERKQSESRKELAKNNAISEGDYSTEESEGFDSEEQFNFVFYIGFDEGDSFYDSEYNMRQMFLAFAVLSHKYPGVHFHVFRHRETKGKPVWVWNELANMAYHDGCDYLFQVNDDMRFLTVDWAPYMVAQLRESPVMPNFGVTGPRDIRRNLLTQAFVHRSHLELFKGYMFPKSFKNWYMDDWIQHVYGNVEEGAFSVKPTLLPHTVPQPEAENSPHPPRYHIDHLAYEHLSEDLILGCQLIQAWLNAQKYEKWHLWPCTVVVPRNSGQEGSSMYLEPKMIHLSDRPPYGDQNDMLYRALSKVAIDHKVVLTFTNWGVIDMTRNWLSYAKMWGITNYLVIALDERSYVSLYEAGVQVIHDPSKSVSADVQEYLKGDYRKLVNMKTYFMWQALGRGFDVFLSDNDVVFLRNPYTDFTLDYEVYFQDDTQRKSTKDPSVALNSGFVMAKSNFRTLDLWEQAYMLTQKEEAYQDQRALNILLATSHRHRVRLAILDSAEYPNGWNFFVSRISQRELAGALPAVIHNNWLQGYASKVHRFREELLWTVDPDNYYANPDLRLLSFTVTRYAVEEEEPVAMQTLDLATALVLARRLNRTLVLPRLESYGSLEEEWGLSSATAEMFYDIERIQAFNGIRESSFVRSPVLKQMREEGKSLAVDRGMLLNLVGADGRKATAREMPTVLGAGSLLRVASSAVIQMDVTRGPQGKLLVDELAEFLGPAVADVGTLLVHCGDGQGGHLNEYLSIGRLSSEEKSELFYALALRSRGPHRPVE